eukprot:Phypoly_transcript_11378.p1 GENE.Phypoly_transcript_11378~~Phypoly_transcript_11378.p1  ORF type:complete len:337 (+),score=33.31 Phypoly_transcript_11378:66-1076(+)
MWLSKVNMVLALLCVLFFIVFVAIIRATQKDLDDEHSVSPHCPWDFTEYIPSPYEKMWVDHAKAWGESPCSRYKLDNNSEIAQIWYNYSAAAMNAPPIHPPDTQIFSTLVYKRTCTGEKKIMYIEPLALMMRNPLACVKTDFWDIVDKNYMLVDWDIKQQRRDTNGRTFLFDMGASLYTAGSGGASQAWFVDNIEKRGLRLDGIYAWEYQVYNATEVFAVIPQRLWPIYYWYNIPVSSKVGSLANPWELMLRVATKDDLVIVKLDIDTPALEVALINQIITNRSISSIIDVLYYEDHTDIAEMRKYFGKNLLNKLDDSMQLFTKMRHLGIRAHPWV